MEKLKGDKVCILYNCTADKFLQIERRPLIIYMGVFQVPGNTT